MSSSASGYVYKERAFNKERDCLTLREEGHEDDFGRVWGNPWSLFSIDFSGGSYQSVEIEEKQPKRVVMLWVHVLNTASLKGLVQIKYCAPMLTVAKQIYFFQDFYPRLGEQHPRLYLQETKSELQLRPLIPSELCVKFSGPEFSRVKRHMTSERTVELSSVPRFNFFLLRNIRFTVWFTAT